MDWRIFEIVGTLKLCFAYQLTFLTFFLRRERKEWPFSDLTWKCQRGNKVKKKKKSTLLTSAGLKGKLLGVDFWNWVFSLFFSFYFALYLSRFWWYQHEPRKSKGKHWRQNMEKLLAMGQQQVHQPFQVQTNMETLTQQINELHIKLKKINCQSRRWKCKINKMKMKFTVTQANNDYAKEEIHESLGTDRKMIPLYKRKYDWSRKVHVKLIRNLYRDKL